MMELQVSQTRRAGAVARSDGGQNMPKQHNNKRAKMARGGQVSLNSAARLYPLRPYRTEM
jgi:hypothetical protein